MAVGSDQSVNLGGMLGQIAQTTGSMADAYKPVMQAATKPRGDMSDPAHLERLAQWASSNGDAAAASMYMSQARTARAEQKEQKTMEHMAGTDKATMVGDMTAQQVAAQGDVTNLDRAITNLRERLQGDFPSVQARNHAKQSLERLEGMRVDAVDQQTQNHAQAVVNIDKSLEAGTNPTAAEALRERKEQLLKDPAVQDAVTANQLKEWRASQAQKEMENQQYLEQNMGALRDAVTDPDRAQEIIDGAPPSGQAAVQQAYTSMRNFQTAIDESRAIMDDVATASDMGTLNAKIEEIPEELRAGAKQALDNLAKAEEYRDSNGRPMTEGHAIRIKKARDDLDRALVTAQNAIGQQEYSSRRARENRDAEEIAKLERQRDNFRPDDVAVSRRAEMLAKEANDVIQIGAQPRRAGSRGTAGRTVYNQGKYMEQARAQLMEENRFDLNKEIMLRTGEAADESDIVISNFKYTGPRDPVTGEPDPAEYNKKANWTNMLPEIETPDREKRGTRYERRSHIYDESFITKAVRG